ncbi:MAG: hypothetical protein P1S60_12850 [Anaerolineae bacterium]|nr:hypothetical protein [Anaerolineae bacterium]
MSVATGAIVRKGFVLSVSDVPLLISSVPVPTDTPVVMTVSPGPSPAGVTEPVVTSVAYDGTQINANEKGRAILESAFILLLRFSLLERRELVEYG